MRLREFDLDLPNADRESRKSFRWSIRSVCSLYARLLPQLVVAEGWKVLVECVERVDRAEPIDQLGVWTLQAPFDYAAFLAADGQGRKMMALETLQSGVLRLASMKEWPTEPFEKAHGGVIAENYVNQWTWPKSKANSTRRLKAVLSCVHDSDRFRAWMVVSDRAGTEVARMLVIDEPPNEFIFVPKMGSVTWVSADRVVLLDKSGREVAGLSVAAPTPG